MKERRVMQLTAAREKKKCNRWPRPRAFAKKKKNNRAQNHHTTPTRPGQVFNTALTASIGYSVTALKIGLEHGHWFKHADSDSYAAT